MSRGWSKGERSGRRTASSSSLACERGSERVDERGHVRNEAMKRRDKLWGDRFGIACGAKARDGDERSMVALALTCEKESRLRESRLRES